MTSWQAFKNGFRAVFAVGALGAVSAPAAFAVPTLSIVVTPATPVANAPVTLDITAADFTDLYGYQFSLAFDPTILRATAITEGAFLASGGATFFDGGTIDNTAGSITLSFNTLISASSGVSGSGILERIGFNALRAGSTALTFSDVIFVNSTFATIAVQANGRSLSVTGNVAPVPEPATCALMALGLAGLATARRRRAA